MLFWLCLNPSHGIVHVSSGHSYGTPTYVNIEAYTDTSWDVYDQIVTYHF